MYPKTLTVSEKISIIGDILDEWLYKLVPHKNIKSVTDLKYNVDIDAIELHQENGITFYYLDKRIIEGYDNAVSEDLRDYLRRRGIKYFTGKPFKSIHV